MKRVLLHLFIPVYVRYTQSQLKHFNFTFTFVLGVGHQHTSVNILLAQESLKANYISYNSTLYIWVGFLSRLGNEHLSQDCFLFSIFSQEI